LHTDGTAVAIGDIDGDGFPEIVTGRTDPVFTPGPDPAFWYDDPKLVAFRRDGSIARSWHLSGMNNDVPGSPTPTIGDFNQDGITEIAVAYPVSNSGSGAIGAAIVTVLTTGAPFHPALNDWPLVYQNPRNTGVLAGAAFFTLTATAAQAVSAGSAATYTIWVTPSPAPYGYAVTNFRCSGLPTGATCAFSPASVTPGAAAGTTMLTITTTSRTLALARPRGHSTRPLFALWLGAGLFGFAGLAAGSRPRRRKMLLPLAVLLLGVAFAVGCGSHSAGYTPPPGPPLNPNGTPAGTYSITVTASGNAGVSRATVVRLTVN
jgi:hypothetical protein